MTIIIKKNVYGELGEVCGGQHRFANRFWIEMAMENQGEFEFVVVAA